MATNELSKEMGFFSMKERSRVNTLRSWLKRSYTRTKHLSGVASVVQNDFRVAFLFSDANGKIHTLYPVR